MSIVELFVEILKTRKEKYKINAFKPGSIKLYQVSYARVAACSNGVFDGGALVPSPPSMIHLENALWHLRHNTFKIISHNPHSTNFIHLPLLKNSQK